MAGVDKCGRPLISGIAKSTSTSNKTAMERTESSPVDGEEVCKQVPNHFSEASRVSPDLKLPFAQKTVIKESKSLEKIVISNIYVFRILLNTHVLYLHTYMYIELSFL